MKYSKVIKSYIQLYNMNLTTMEQQHGFSVHFIERDSKCVIRQTPIEDRFMKNGMYITGFLRQLEWIRNRTNAHNNFKRSYVSWGRLALSSDSDHHFSKRDFQYHSNFNFKFSKAYILCQYNSYDDHVQTSFVLDAVCNLSQVPTIFSVIL